MPSNKAGLAMATALLALSAQHAQAIDFELQADNRVEACRNIQDMIEYYSDLQSKGGTASVMKGWARFRTKYENQFVLQQCTRMNNDQGSLTASRADQKAVPGA